MDYNTTLPCFKPRPLAIEHPTDLNSPNWVHLKRIYGAHSTALSDYIELRRFKFSTTAVKKK